LGAEFFPLTTADVLHRYPFLLIGCGILVFTFISINQKFNNKIRGWGLAFILFGVMAIFSTRNLTHLYPIFIIFICLILSEIIEKISKMSQIMRDKIISLGLTIFALVISYCTWQTYIYLNIMLQSDFIYGEHFTRIAAIINQQIPAGNRIFHANWSDSQYLIGLAPKYEYIETLDPIYMYTYDQNLYTLYRQVSFGQNSDPYKIISEIFKTKYGYAGKNYFNDLIKQVKNDKRFEILAEDNLGVLFALMPK
jgi:hypothetical protein